MARPGQRSGRSGLRWVLAAAACVGSALACSAAVEDRSVIGPADPDAATAINQAADVDGALAFTEAEQADLDAVADGDDQLAHQGLYALLRHAAALPGEDQLLDRAELATGMDLVANPAVHRGRLVCQHVRIWRISRWNDPTDAPTRGWGLRPVWRLDCQERASEEPLIVLLTELPEGMITGDLSPPADRTVLGLFYKVVRLPVERPAETDRATKLYPVIVAKTLYGAQGPRGNLGKIILVALLLVLIVGYVLAKRSAKGAPPAAAPAAPEGPADEPVDQELVKAVEQHEQQPTEGGSE